MNHIFEKYIYFLLRAVTCLYYHKSNILTKVHCFDEDVA